MTEFAQSSAYDSPWTIQQRIKLLVWEYVWWICCSWTPKPANPWRLWWLKMFGAKIIGTPFVHQRARIQIPWNLEMHHRSCLGDRSNAYSLGKILLMEHSTIAQEAYLCTGTHAFDKPSKNLITSPIIVGKNVFVGARVFVLPGIEIGENAIIGACSVVTKNVLAGSVVKGNPAK